MVAGPITLKKDTITAKGESVDLATIMQLKIERGWLYVARVGDTKWWTQVSLGTRDARVLIPLLDRAVKPTARLK
jgi:hypothetical protein